MNDVKVNERGLGLKSASASEFTFSKYHGTGNDFILIDDREEVFPVCPEIITQLCHPKYGIGTDGLILLRSSDEGDFRMRIFNKDGSEAEMCGNGLRCLIQFIRDLGVDQESFKIETMKKIYPCSIKNGQVFVEMGIPKILEKMGSDILLEVGVPHFVTFAEDLAEFDEEAPKKFSDLGVNINYAKLEPFRVIRMRTFERGVEEETYSCGSGATATAFAAWMKFGLSGPVTIVFGSGEELQFEIALENQDLIGITMSGDVAYVFEGKVRI
ncbi:MAG: diaminopimelate epimerase [Chlamydiales bacterium]|nr:diaminopimelate epimerase [Chlamydiales bacterium]